jgi:hypothetical protein
MSIEEVDLTIRMRVDQSRKRVDDGAEVVLHASPFATAAATCEPGDRREQPLQDKTSKTADLGRD